MIVPIAIAAAVIGAVVVNEVRSANRPAPRRVSGPAGTRTPDTWMTRGK